MGCPRGDSIWSSREQVLSSAQERIQGPDGCRKTQGVYESKITYLSRKWGWTLRLSRPEKVPIRDFITPRGRTWGCGLDVTCLSTSSRWDSQFSALLTLLAFFKTVMVSRALWELQLPQRKWHYKDIIISYWSGPSQRPWPCQVKLVLVFL